MRSLSFGQLLPGRVFVRGFLPTVGRQAERLRLSPSSPQLYVSESGSLARRPPATRRDSLFHVPIDVKHFSDFKTRRGKSTER